MMTHFIMVLLALASAFAGDSAGRIAVIAQRSTHRGLEQIALVFEGRHVELVTNSNFLQGPGPVARLGDFESEATGKLETRRREVEDIYRRLQNSSTKVHGGAGYYQSPHRIRYLLGGHELNMGAQYRDAVKELLESVWTLADWKPIETVSVTLDSERAITLAYAGKQSFSQTKTPADYGCEASPAPASLRCEIYGLGTAYLAKEAVKRDE
jgi:hypothetical protein